MIKSVTKSLIAKLGLRIARSNGLPMQFDGLYEAMQMLRTMGYKPCSIIDGGAHLGAFALQARRNFPNAHLHMVEPQKACKDRLIEFANRDPKSTFYQTLLTSNNVPYVSFVESDTPSTGSRVAESGKLIAASCLDDLFGNLCGPSLLKLDLQGHELAALEGGRNILASIIDFALIETSIFVEHDEAKVFDIINFMHHYEFDIFDIVAMGRRSRDGRLRQADLLFAKRNTPIWHDRIWK